MVCFPEKERFPGLHTKIMIKEMIITKVVITAAGSPSAVIEEAEKFHTPCQIPVINRLPPVLLYKKVSKTACFFTQKNFQGSINPHFAWPEHRCWWCIHRRPMSFPASVSSN